MIEINLKRNEYNILCRRKIAPGFPSLVKGGRLKFYCGCFVGSNPTPGNWENGRGVR